MSTNPEDLEKDIEDLAGTVDGLDHFRAVQEKRLNRLEERVERVDRGGKYGEALDIPTLSEYWRSTTEHVAKLEGRLDALEEQVDALENWVGALENQVGALENQVGALVHQRLAKRITELEDSVLGAREDRVSIRDSLATLRGRLEAVEAEQHPTHDAQDSLGALKTDLHGELVQALWDTSTANGGRLHVDVRNKLLEIVMRAMERHGACCLEKGPVSG